MGQNMDSMKNREPTENQNIFYTDGGKDFRSNHLQQIGMQLGFVCHLRDRETFLTQKKTKKERQKAEQAVVQKAKQPLLVEPE